jgi:hypothetical protein
MGYLHLFNVNKFSLNLNCPGIGSFSRRLVSVVINLIHLQKQKQKTKQNKTKQKPKKSTKRANVLCKTTKPTQRLV